MMASSFADSPVEAPSASPQRSSNRGNVRLYQTLVSAVWLGYLAWAATMRGAAVANEWAQLLPWILLLTVVNLLPIEGWHWHIVTDMPIGVAATLVLNPFEAGIVGFISAFDLKEFQRKIPVNHGAFNRVQTGIVYASGSAIVHSLAPSTKSPALILPLAFLALTVTFLINCMLVGTSISIEFRQPLVHVMKKFRVGTWIDFGVAFAAWGVLGAMLAALYQAAHFWALLAFVSPTLLGRQVLARSQMFIDTRRAYRSRETALVELSKRMYEERSDERHLIAADLHDEVLQPLFKVTLMAQVLKGDLSGGRLLEMDEDLPELLTAAELASSTLRELIGDLRRSSLGRGGLGQALESLAQGIDLPP
jgi:signal transduction histidine kinase